MPQRNPLLERLREAISQGDFSSSDAPSPREFLMSLREVLPEEEFLKLLPHLVAAERRPSGETQGRELLEGFGRSIREAAQFNPLEDLGSDFSLDDLDSLLRGGGKAPFADDGIFSTKRLRQGLSELFGFDASEEEIAREGHLGARLQDAGEAITRSKQNIGEFLFGRGEAPIDDGVAQAVARQAAEEQRSVERNKVAEMLSAFRGREEEEGNFNVPLFSIKGGDVAPVRETSGSDRGGQFGDMGSLNYNPRTAEDRAYAQQQILAQEKAKAEIYKAIGGDIFIGMKKDDPARDEIINSLAGLLG